MARTRYCVLSAAHLLLIASFTAVGISFFGPFWLGNVDPQEDLANALTPAQTATYFLYELPMIYNDSFNVRGLWGQCGRKCQSFWENGYSLQKELFTPLRWHLATQILYFIGAAIVLISIVFSQAQICCGERACTFRVLGGLMLFSFCLQTAAVAVFGGGAWKEYTAKSSPIMNVHKWSDNTDVYFDWCFWMAVAGGALSLLSGTFYLVYDCLLARSYDYKD